MSETEQPFRPHEKLVEKQRYFQNIHKHTYLKGPMDKITSVAIPLALAGDEESTTCHTGLGRKNEAVAHVNGNGQPS